MLERCEIQWEFRYPKGLKIPPGVDMIRGSGVHRGVGRNLRQKIESFVDLPEDEVTDAARDHVVSAFKGDVTMSAEERTIGARRLAGRTSDTAAAMAAEHHRTLAPTIQPTLVEHKITLKASKALDADLVGIIDLVSEQDDQIVIRDLKTSAKRKSQEDADRDEGLSTYVLLERARSGRMIGRVALDVVVETTAGKIYSETLWAKRGPEDLKVLVRRFQRALEVIERGVFMPRTPDFWCSERWCGYWGICKFGGRY